jgi:hypothetical protein
MTTLFKTAVVPGERTEDRRLHDIERRAQILAERVDVLEGGNDALRERLDLIEKREATAAKPARLSVVGDGEAKIEFEMMNPLPPPLVHHRGGGRWDVLVAGKPVNTEGLTKEAAEELRESL